VAVNAPHGPLTPATVGRVVADAARRAGVGGVTAHRLRHTAATEMLREGASLIEIGQVLRHRQTQTTAIYAKCAARRSVVSPAQPGGTRRKVLGSNGLPGSER
jgi:site-specific recombinase XerD